jgi:hypothetical protein
MANRFPLIIDTSDNNKIKELPVGDNLDLTGSNIVNAGSIQTTGSVTAGSLNVNGQNIATVALSGDYNDLDNTPVAFTGAYNDLTGKPTIPSSIRELSDVQDTEPSNGEVLVWNSLLGRFEPGEIDTSIDLSTSTLQDLGNVIISGPADNKYLKYYSGAWRAANVTYAEVQNAPTLLSQFVNDAGFITSDSDSQTLTLDGTELTISNGNTVDLLSLLDNTDAQTLSLVGTDLTISNGNTVDLASIVGDSVGNFTFASSVIDTDDSSPITITPSVVTSSSLTVESDLTVNGDIITASTGTPEVFSETSILLTATDRVEVTQSPLKMASFTSAERDALTAENGDTIYNTTTNKFQGYANGSWVDLH